MEGETVSSQSRKSFDTVSILVVDDDLTCLAIVAAILKKFKYEVVTVKHPSDALCTLRIKGGAFDLVVSDIHMPDMNGFELQQVITQEFHLPVVLMSADNKEGVISKGLENGAAFFISKPVTPDDLRNLWQFASTKKKTSSRVVINEITGSNYDLFQPREIINSNDKNRSDEKPVFVVSASTSNKDISHSKKNPKRKPQTKEDSDNDEEEIGNNNNAASTNKKPKVVWTDSLHNRFLEAIRSIGLDRSVPKKILEEMNVPGLTRENVASHLQKYRIFLRRVSDASSKISGVDEKGLFSRSGINRYSKYQFYHHRQNLGNFDFPGGIKMQAQSRFGQSHLISSNRSLFQPNIGPNNRLCGGIAPQNNYETGPILFPGNLSGAWENPNITTPRNNVVSSIPSTNFSDRTNYVGYSISNIKHLGDEYSRSCDNIGEYDNRGPEINCNGELNNNINNNNINLEQLMDVVNGGEQLSDVVNANHDHQENLLPPFLGINEGIISEGQNGDLSDVFSTPIFHQLPEFDDTTANQLFADQLTIQNQLPEQGNGSENIASSSLYGSTNNRGNDVSSYDQAPDQRDDDDFLASLLAFGTFGEEQQFDGI